MATWQFVYAKRFSFYPPDYEDPGLGGSEGVLIVLTRTLASRGQDVTVYNCCYRPGVYDSVTWRPLHELADADTPDVRVAVRIAESTAPIRGAQNAFWMLDNRAEGAAHFLTAVCEEDALVVVASDAMNRLLLDAGVAIQPLLIPFPVETTLYPTAASETRPICLYTSIADRGLDVVLTIWPRVREAVPEAELRITGGHELWGFTQSEAAVLAQRVTDRFGELDGASYLGVVNRQTLRDLQQSAALLLYPCREQEMFCLAVAEAAAAGTPAVTTAAHALTERVIDGVTGVLIPGEIDDPAVQDRFVGRAVELLRDKKSLATMARRAQEHAQELDAHSVAARWEEAMLGRST